MKIKIDFDACESNALCEAFAPQNFHLDDNDVLALLEDVVTDATRDAVAHAVAMCPTLAITLVEE